MSEENGSTKIIHIHRLKYCGDAESLTLELHPGCTGFDLLEKLGLRDYWLVKKGIFIPLDTNLFKFLSEGETIYAVFEAVV